MHASVVPDEIYLKNCEWKLGMTLKRKLKIKNEHNWMTAERQCERVFSTENYNLYFIELA